MKKMLIIITGITLSLNMLNLRAKGILPEEENPEEAIESCYHKKEGDSCTLFQYNGICKVDPNSFYFYHPDLPFHELLCSTVQYESTQPIPEQIIPHRIVTRVRGV